MEDDVKQAFEKIDQNFADVKKAFEFTWSMMERNSEEIKSELRAEFRGEMAELRAHTDARFEEVHAEIADVRADISIVAEGVIKVNEKFDRLADLPARVAALEARSRR